MHGIFSIPARSVLRPWPELGPAWKLLSRSMKFENRTSMPMDRETVQIGTDDKMKEFSQVRFNLLQRAFGRKVAQYPARYAGESNF
jgi:hypothetical protein